MSTTNQRPVLVPALLALEDGTVFHGKAIGAHGSVCGEVVFNTSMTGYQEIITDPSYAEQLVTLTYPHIGNVGCNDFDGEAPRPMASGLIIRDLPSLYSNWRASESLPAYLQRHSMIGIAEIDTRQLTRILRDKGAQNGCLAAGDNLDVDACVAAARGFPGLKGMDVAIKVTVDDRQDWSESPYDLDADGIRPTGKPERHVVAFDYGTKRAILQLLTEQGCRVTMVPADTSAEDVLSLKPDGVFLSNGPGDPDACQYAVKAIREILDRKVPVFGICLGHQLLALASGATTVKMKFGHHGANHPVADLESGRVMITSQNHGFAVDESSLPDNVKATHRSLFDSSLQGIEFTDRPAFSFQGHPEASPGPHDIRPLFEKFTQLMQA